MLLEIPKVLNAEQLQLVRDKLDTAGDAWVDGRATAGHQGAQVKRNLQINEHAPIAIELGDLILAELERHPLLSVRRYPITFIHPCSISIRVGWLSAAMLTVQSGRFREAG